uniref:Uncharacterized protein n=1 Tax=Cyanistes caeruleus TaxID=156563 RepID=A0A8C0Z8Z7_CYACU
FSSSGFSKLGLSKVMNVRPLQIQQFSKKEIEDLLRKGAYAAIMDEDDEGAKFCEEDIEQILLRRSTTITIESEGKGSTFSKVRLENIQLCGVREPHGH